VCVCLCLVLKSCFYTDEDSIIKLCDFGFAKQAQTADEILGTPCGKTLLFFVCLFVCFKKI
jgi:serine/threonine protein kinase